MTYELRTIFNNARVTNTVEKLLQNWQRDGQTIYGDLSDWAKDNYWQVLDSNQREELVKMLIADYVIRHSYCLQKSYIVLQESNVDGELIINPVPCQTMEAAKRVLADEKRTILRESHHFGGRPLDDFEVEDEEEHFYINDPCDDYYEDIKIIEKDIAV